MFSCCGGNTGDIVYILYPFFRDQELYYFLISHQFHEKILTHLANSLDAFLTLHHVEAMSPPLRSNGASDDPEKYVHI